MANEMAAQKSGTTAGRKPQILKMRTRWQRKRPLPRELSQLKALSQV